MTVYFIQRGKQGPIKIGVTKYLYRRLAEIQRSYPQRLRILGIIDGYLDQERVLHERFAHLRLDGEWFSIANELSNYIDKNTSPPFPPHLDRSKYRQCKSPTKRGGICSAIAQKDSDYCLIHNRTKSAQHL